MDLTPLDVRRKKEDLRRSVRGYDSGQVDAFLDVVADRLESLVRSEVRLSEEVRLLREQLESFKERERALNEALIAAQELREETRAQAERAAEIRIREAKQEAEKLVGEARTAVRAHETSLVELGSRRAGLLREMRSLLERFLGDVRAEQDRSPVESESDRAFPGEARARGWGGVGADAAPTPTHVPEDASR